MLSPALLLLLLSPEAPYEPDYLAYESDIFTQEGPQYRQCVQDVANDLETGRQGAQRWAADAGGAAAEHCLAIADLAAGLPRLAAVRFLKISERADAGGDEARALVLAQAALAWLDANERDFADEAATRARALAPAPAALLMVAANVYGQPDRWQAASDAVPEAEEAGIATAEAYIIRARAERALGKNRVAAENVISALKLDPFNLDALVLRGELIQAGMVINADYTPKGAEKDAAE